MAQAPSAAATGLVVLTEASVSSTPRAPARHLQVGAETVAERPWEATRRHVVEGEVFEVYPNGDSLPFVEQYGLPAARQPRTFVRGTLRPEGRLRAWDAVFGPEPRRRPARRRELAREGIDFALRVDG